MTPSRGCAGCGKASLILTRKEQWGGCPFCAAIAAAGAIFGWSFTLSFWLFQDRAGVAWYLAVISAAFSVFFALHAAAYALRNARRGDS